MDCSLSVEAADARAAADWLAVESLRWLARVLLAGRSWAAGRDELREGLLVLVRGMPSPATKTCSRTQVTGMSEGAWNVRGTACDITLGGGCQLCAYSVEFSHVARASGWLHHRRLTHKTVRESDASEHVVASPTCAGWSLYLYPPEYASLMLSEPKPR